MAAPTTRETHNAPLLSIVTVVSTALWTPAAAWSAEIKCGFGVMPKHGKLKAPTSNKLLKLANNYSRTYDSGAAGHRSTIFANTSHFHIKIL